MQQSRRSRALPLVLTRAIAFLVLVPLIALGVAAAFSSGTGPASASSAVRSKDYSGGIMMAADPSGGYWTVTTAGAVTPRGGAPALGSPALSNLHLAQPIVGMTATPDGNGYWLVASDGGIFSYGDATFYGSTGAIHLNKPVVGMASTTDGHGYWLVASDGGIFSYGNAQFYGSTGSIRLNKPVVGMAATTDGNGYWLVASDGGIFSYGNAQFYGSTGSIHLNLPVVGMAPTPDGQGYYLVGFDGGVFTYGDANFYGSTAGWGAYVYGMIVNPAAAGYTVVTANGQANVFGPGLNPYALWTGSLQQGAYDSSPTPAGHGGFRPADKDLADRRQCLPERQQRLGDHGRLGREPQLPDLVLPGDRLHARPRGPDHPDLGRGGGGHAGPGGFGSLQLLLRHPGADAGGRR